MSGIKLFRVGYPAPAVELYSSHGKAALYFDRRAEELGLQNITAKRTESVFFVSSEEGTGFWLAWSGEEKIYSLNYEERPLAYEVKFYDDFYFGYVEFNDPDATHSERQWAQDFMDKSITNYFDSAVPARAEDSSHREVLIPRSSVGELCLEEKVLSNSVRK